MTNPVYLTRLRQRDGHDHPIDSSRLSTRGEGDGAGRRCTTGGAAGQVTSADIGVRSDVLSGAAAGARFARALEWGDRAAAREALLGLWQAAELVQKPFVPGSH